MYDILGRGVFVGDCEEIVVPDFRNGFVVLLFLLRRRDAQQQGPRLSGGTTAENAHASTKERVK